MLLEVCIDSFSSAQAAIDGGAERLEVCSDLAVGGLTPTRSLIEEIQHYNSIPLMVMVRPRAGNFVYTPAEVDLLLSQITMAKELAVQGVVLGVLHQDGTVDQRLLQRLCDEADDIEVTFHRAYDVCTDPDGAIDILIDVGVNRLLTSGRQPTAIEGARHLQELVGRTQSSGLVIMAGSGLSAACVAELVTQTGVREVHGSCRTSRSGSTTDSKQVQEIVRLLTGM